MTALHVDGDLTLQAENYQIYKLVNILFSFALLHLIDGSLMFEQVPIVETDRMKLVQTRAIISYTATKCALHGKDMKETGMYDIFSLGNTYVLS
ncbi:Glutathione S-transferase A1 [Lemmus lemmus]